MKKVIGFLPCWGCFWLGHGVSKLFEVFEGGWLYSIYNRFMLWSLDINDWAGLDVWSKPKQDKGD